MGLQQLPVPQNLIQRFMGLNVDRMPAEIAGRDDVFFQVVDKDRFLGQDIKRFSGDPVNGGIGFHDARLKRQGQLIEQLKKIMAGFQQPEMGVARIRDHAEIVPLFEDGQQFRPLRQKPENVRPGMDQFFGGFPVTGFPAHPREKLFRADPAGFIIKPVRVAQDDFVDLSDGNSDIGFQFCQNRIPVEIDQHFSEIEEDRIDSLFRACIQRMSLATVIK